MNAGVASDLFDFPPAQGEALGNHGREGHGAADEGEFDDDDEAEQHQQGDVELMQLADTLVQDPNFFEVVRRNTSASILPQVCDSVSSVWESQQENQQYS
jgi:hypothetical protein